MMLQAPQTLLRVSVLKKRKNYSSKFFQYTAKTQTNSFGFLQYTAKTQTNSFRFLQYTTKTKNNSSGFLQCTAKVQKIMEREQEQKKEQEGQQKMQLEKFNGVRRATLDQAHDQNVLYMSSNMRCLYAIKVQFMIDVITFPELSLT